MFPYKLWILLDTLPFAVANIDFTWVQPSCQESNSYNSCLRGQTCRNTSCVPDFQSKVEINSAPERRSLGHLSFSRLLESTRFNLGYNRHVKPRAQARAAQATTLNGRCGVDFDQAVCDNWPRGSCCSSYGYCGNTPAHCGLGCQSGPCLDASSNSAKLGASAVVKSSALAPPSSSTLTSASRSTLSSASSSVSSSVPSPITKDGTCGAKNGGTICGNWNQGDCCSMYGYCGKSPGHCGPGCQSGSCDKAPVAAAPDPKPAPLNSNPGIFEVIGQSGVPAMHSGLLPNGRIVFLDKIENYTQLKLDNMEYAYSSEWDPITNQMLPLGYKTNAFCAGGMPLADGRFMSVGGNGPLDFIDSTVGDGFKAIRYLTRSPIDRSFDGQDWDEPGNQLASARWYPSVQIMPDGRQFVASGSLNGLDPNLPANNNPTYEILDQNGISSGVSVNMSILINNQPYYMYPFIHLLNDGNLFIFTARSSQIFNLDSNTVVKQFKDLVGDYRTYPNTGGSVMLPLSSSNNYNPDIVVCGGGPYQDITAPTDASCGRIQPMSSDPTWELDAMPEGRCMVEGVLLLDGTVLWINGANRGAQGFGVASNPTLDALIYDPNQPLGSRFTKAGRSKIPRLYHSVAMMLLDGTILVSGSNPVEQPILQPSAQNPYVTEFRMERYTPPYLAGRSARLRPKRLKIGDKGLSSVLEIIPGGPNFTINFALASAATKDLKVVLYYSGFVTHSVHMGHRMIYCDYVVQSAIGTSRRLSVSPPPNHNITPPGYYILFVVADGVPSIGQHVMIK